MGGTIRPFAMGAHRQNPQDEGGGWAPRSQHRSVTAAAVGGSGAWALKPVTSQAAAKAVQPGRHS